MPSEPHIHEDWREKAGWFFTALPLGNGLKIFFPKRRHHARSHLGTASLRGLARDGATYPPVSIKRLSRPTADKKSPPQSASPAPLTPGWGFRFHRPSPFCGLTEINAVASLWRPS